jgi:hypothetical protein
MQEGRLGLGIKLKPKGITNHTWVNVLITYYSLSHIAYISHSPSIRNLKIDMHVALKK